MTFGSISALSMNKLVYVLIYLSNSFVWMSCGLIPHVGLILAFCKNENDISKMLRQMLLGSIVVASIWPHTVIYFCKSHFDLTVVEA